MTDRYENIRKLYGEENYRKIHASKLLVIGAGGIGCEILKNLVYLGFKQIHVVDLDTIDVSNLNRQFLFRPEHVGKSKAIIAAEQVTKFNPDVQITAYHDNIKNNNIFNVSFFESFDIVLNGLDNVDARRHVNRMCLASKTPLIDSGTTGYLGQVMPIIGNVTACYECFPKPTQKTYPVCTIRSTPDKPVHCIVWAKECFKLLFARPNDSMLFEDDGNTGDKSVYMDYITFPTENERSLDNICNFAKKLIIGLFHDDIQKRIDMNVYKTAKKVPLPIDKTIIEDSMTLVKERVEYLFKHYNQTSASSNIFTANSIQYGAGWDQRKLSLEQNLMEFVFCLFEIVLKESEEKQSLLGQLSFDKDDFWAMRFVAVAANIRAWIFGIEIQSFHDAKGVAGNIIPAIATTNAIIAGIQIQMCIKLLNTFTNKQELYSRLESDKEELMKQINKICPHTYCLRNATRRGHYIEPSMPELPVSTCFVCGSASLTLQIDVNESTLQDLLDKVIKQKLGFTTPSIMKGYSILYEEGDECDEDLQENLSLKLANCPAGGIVDGTFLTLEDFTQKLEVKLIVKHVDNKTFAAEDRNDGNGDIARDMFILEGEAAFQARQEQAEVNKSSDTSADVQEPASTTVTARIEDDEVMIIEEQDINTTKVRKASDAGINLATTGDDEDEHRAKKRKVVDILE